MSNNVAFDVPVNTGNMPVIRSNSTDKHESLAIRDHTEGRRKTLLYKNTHKALSRAVIECVDNEFIADLEDKNIGCEDYSVMDLLTYLGDEYVAIESNDLDENRNKISDPFDMDIPLPVFIKALQDIHNFSEEGGQQIEDASMVMDFFNRMKESGMVEYDVRNWEDKPAAENTFTNIKTHFQIAWRRY